MLLLDRWRARPAHALGFGRRGRPFGLVGRSRVRETQSGEHVRLQRVLGQGSQAGEHALGVQHRAWPARVYAGVGEERTDRVWTQGVIPPGDDLMKVDERRLLRFGNGPRPVGMAVARPGDLAVAPDVARDQ